VEQIAASGNKKFVEFSVFENEYWIEVQWLPL
jgi:hypothetical protein